MAPKARRQREIQERIKKRKHTFSYILHSFYFFGSIVMIESKYMWKHKRPVERDTCSILVESLPLCFLCEVDY